MVRIRVNTEDLKIKAKDFESAAEAFNRAGDEIASVAMSMPSYDGQLSGPARKVGYDIQSQARDLRSNLTDDAASLQRTAKAFEEVDNRAIEEFLQNQSSVLSAVLSTPTHPPRKGNAYLGYQDDGGDTVILCIYGKCRKVNRKGHEKEIEDFEQAVINYYNDVENMLEHAENLIAKGFGVIVASVTAGAPTAGWGALLADIAGYFLLKAELDALNADKELVEGDINDATFAWNKIFGENLETDDKQSPIDIWTRNSQDIYEP
jgi:uncharacterized protein YukE